MNCSEFDKELELVVEARQRSLPDRMALHVTECSGCRQKWVDQQLIEVALRAWLPVQCPETLAESTLSQLLRERTSASIPVTSRAEARAGWGVVATVACLLLVLGLGLITGPNAGDSGVASRSRKASSVAQPVESIEVASSMAAVLDDLRSEYQELAAETSATARELAVVLPATPVAPWVDAGLSDIGFKPVEPTNDQVIAKPAEGAVSVIGRSIGSQIGQAMDFLWVAVPDSVPRG